MGNKAAKTRNANANSSRNNVSGSRASATSSTAAVASSPASNYVSGSRASATSSTAAVTSRPASNYVSGSRASATSSKGVKFLNVIVAAIDFGTTFSGFAYCTKYDYNYPGGPRIKLHSWQAQARMTGKAPTCVLLDSDQNFISFGYEANTNFVEGKGSYFFKHFKMKLYEMKEELSRDTILESQDGKTMPAIRVFSAVIKFFKNKLLTDLKSKGDLFDHFHASDIHWVLTVPAIWNLKAKLFMREAANMAGIDDNQLTLALEPEAASLFCRKVPSSVDRTTNDGPSIANFKAGAKYLIMDLGGGTIDIIAHEVLQNGNLKEIIEPTGGYWGSLRVNEEFTRFLQRLCGQDVLSELQTNKSDDWQEIVDEFERKKCAYDPNGKLQKVTLRIPSTLPAEFENLTGCRLEECINQSPFHENVEFKGDKIKMDKTLFETFFNESTTNTVRQVEELLDQTPQLRDLGTILVVGGYAESPLMQRAIKAAFAHRYKIVIPDNPSLAILQGAVMYGFEQDVVESRVCKYTYGLGHQRRFIEGVDDPKKKKKYGRYSYVDDAFDRHVSKGDLVQYGKFQDGKDYHPLNNNQTQAWFDFYASDAKDPKFVNENTCVCLGFVGVELSPRAYGLDATVTLEINISGTDIEVRATEKKTGNVTKAYCNFLG